MTVFAVNADVSQKDSTESVSEHGDRLLCGKGRGLERAVADYNSAIFDSVRLDKYVSASRLIGG